MSRTRMRTRGRGRGGRGRGGRGRGRGGRGGRGRSRGGTSSSLRCFIVSFFLSSFSAPSLSCSHGARSLLAASSLPSDALRPQFFCSLSLFLFLPRQYCLGCLCLNSGALLRSSSSVLLSCSLFFSAHFSSFSLRCSLFCSVSHAIRSTRFVCLSVCLPACACCPPSSCFLFLLSSSLPLLLLSFLWLASSALVFSSFAFFTVFAWLDGWMPSSSSASVIFSFSRSLLCCF